VNAAEVSFQLTDDASGHVSIFCAWELGTAFALGLPTNAPLGKWRVWFCHGACFCASLTDPPDAPGFFDPAHF
jgi:hypothetical protein